MESWCEKVVRVGVHLRTEDGIEPVADPVRVGDSYANGAAEGAVKEVKRSVGR